MDHVVVVGAGIAGVSAAEALRAAGYAGCITIFAGEDRLPYDRPPLSKAALLEEPCPAPELLRPDSFYDDHDIVLRLGTAATGIDRSEGTVTIAGGERLRADRVLLCTGGRPRTLAVPGADLDGVVTLRTDRDAARIRAALERGARVAVVGGGFIGTEVAAAAAERDCPTVVLEAAELPMLRALGPAVAARMADAHRARGVEIRAGVEVVGFAGRHAVERVELAGGVSVPADLVVVGIGMVPETTLGAVAGLQCDNGVHVDSQGRTSNPAVFAAGDVAAVLGPDGVRRRSEHWQSAEDQGAALARTVLGFQHAAPPVPWFWSDQFDLNLQLAGRPQPEDAQVVRGDLDTLTFSVLHHRDGVVTGITAVNRGKDVRPATELIRSGAPLDITLLSDPSTTLKTLLKSVR